MPGLFHADQRGREHRAHRTGIDPAVSVAPDRMIDRAMIHAGAAANAAQHFLEARAEHGRTAVIKQHHVIVLGSVAVAETARAGRERGVDRHLLARCRTRENAQDLADILECRHQLFDGRQHDVGLRQDLRQIAIALVGDDHRGAGFGDKKIGARNAHIGGEKPLPQHVARLGQQLHRFGEVALRIETGCGRGENPAPLASR